MWNDKRDSKNNSLKDQVCLQIIDDILSECIIICRKKQKNNKTQAPIL